MTRSIARRRYAVSRPNVPSAAMVHTPLLRKIVWLNELACAGEGADFDAARTELASRRRFIQGVAAGTGLAVTPVWLTALAQTPSRIVIVGAGLAGLTCAYLLRKAGLKPVVYDGAKRLGGRCVTNRTAFPGQHVEEGGEFIEARHTAIRVLANDLGVPLRDEGSDFDLARGDPVYLINDAPYTAAAVYQDLLAIRNQVMSDLAAAPFPTRWDKSTPRAQTLDNMSVAQWIQQYVPGGAASRLGRLLTVAYVNEFGAETNKQSALNLVYTLGTAGGGPPGPLGDKNRRYRVSGGADRLIGELAKRQGSADIHLNHGLTRLARNADGTYALRFSTPGGTQNVTADHVVLALSFAALRSHVDYSAAGFDQRKQMAIGKQAMGEHALLHVQFKERYWWNVLRRTGLGYGEPYQAVWSPTRGQVGTPGILTNSVGGLRARQLNAGPLADHVKQLLEYLDRTLPGVKNMATGTALLSYWVNHTWTRGSRSYYAPGDRLLFGGYEGVPQGRAHFCGEHTSVVTPGTMNGAVETGMRCAEEILQDVAEGGGTVPPPEPEPEPEPQPEPGLPSWVPLPGRVKRLVTANTFAAVDPCPSDTCTYNATYNGIGNDMVLRSFSGGIYNPYYSNYGAIVIHGGGHGNYGGNETYVFDLDTLAFKRLDNPTDHPSLTVKSVPGNLWNLQYCEYIDGQPASSHSFDNLAIIPPGKGGGTRGSLLRAVSMACGKESRSTGYSHIFDLAQPAQRWKRFSVNAYNGNKVPPTGACAYDSKRNCVWQFVHGNAIVGKLDVAAKTWTNYPMAQGMGDLRPDSLTAQYYAPRDIVVLWAYRRTTPKSTGVWVFNPNNPTAGVQRITLTLPIPPSTTSEVIGGDICTHNGRLYLITPADEDAVFEVTIGATATWTVRRLPWEGSAADVSAIGSAIDLVVYTFKRFAYCSKARCFVYIPARNAPVFAFRPPGV
ncbi:MAG: FAD-dependent oxidoreductase [Pseudomonadota bacterium]